MNIKINFSNKKIQDVKKDDYVLSYDGKQNVISRVNHKYNPLIIKEEQVTVETNNSSFTSSLSHKMFVNKEYKTLFKTDIGDKLFSIDGSEIDIKNIKHNGEEDEEFYDLEIENTHSYYIVGNNNEYFLSHNSATVNVPFWHFEIEDVMVLKNNAGTDDNRVRKLDYCIQVSRLLFDRLVKNEDITLFSPHECKDLYDAFGLPEFDELYVKKEKDDNIKMKKKIPAKSFIELLSRERLETGRYYIMYMDNVNSNNSFNGKINMTNLCVEVLQNVIPINSIDDTNGEIGVCTLAAINVLETDFDEYEEACDIAVRMLDAIIDYQDYLLPASEKFSKTKRSLGIGITNFAGLLAYNKIKYTSPDAIEMIDKIGEYLQYYCVKSSCELAKESGKSNPHTKYINGEFPIDRANKNAKALTTRQSELDWESLRANVKEYGVKNATLTAQMPVESSSVIQNSTNGIEPIRNLLTYKESKKGLLKQLAPNVQKRKEYYTIAWDVADNKIFTDISATFQKWIDMGISTNHYYNYKHYENGNIPLSKIAKDIMYGWKMGLKTIYYSNTPDDSAEMNSSCSSGACAI